MLLQRSAAVLALTGEAGLALLPASGEIAISALAQSGLVGRRGSGLPL